MVYRVNLSVIVRENRAEPKDRGRPFTFIFSQYKSYPKRLTTMIFAEVGVRFSSRYHHIMIFIMIDDFLIVFYTDINIQFS